MTSGKQRDEPDPGAPEHPEADATEPTPARWTADRRAFLRMLSLAAGAGGLARFAPAAAAAVVPPAAAELSPDTIVINALGGLYNPNVQPAPAAAAGAPGTAGTAAPTPAPASPAPPEVDDLDARALRDARRSGLTAVNVTLGYVAGPQEPFESTVAEIAQWNRRLRDHAADLLQVFTAEDIRRAKREGRIGIIYGFQNAAAVGETLARVELFGNLGVRVMQLTYNPRNLLGDGSMVAANHGLTPLGRQVIERLNQSRMMVDLSHSGERTCLEAAGVSRQPISINHTGCRALVDLPRNKTDEELRLVASRGGFVGIYFMPFLAADGHAHAADVVAHLEHAVNVCGEDHVGIGTDGPVTSIDDLEAYRSQLAKEVAARAAAGIGAKGERADTLPFVVDLRGVEQFRILARRLGQRGHSPARIDKILGGNFLRFAELVWGS